MTARSMQTFLKSLRTLSCQQIKSLVKTIVRIVQVEVESTMMKQTRESKFMATHKVSVDVITKSPRASSKKSSLDTR